MFFFFTSKLVKFFCTALVAGFFRGELCYLRVGGLTAYKWNLGNLRHNFILYEAADRRAATKYYLEPPAAR